MSVVAYSLSIIFVIATVVIVSFYVTGVLKPTAPAATRPVTTVPVTTAPATTRPATIAPATTAPATTVPATTAPATTAPATTAPATTAPATTAPATTAPATTAPATTAPATTAPATTAPATTAPATTRAATTAPANITDPYNTARTHPHFPQPCSSDVAISLPASWKPTVTLPPTAAPTAAPATTAPVTTAPPTTAPATAVLPTSSFCETITNCPNFVATTMLDSRLQITMGMTKWGWDPQNQLRSKFNYGDKLVTESNEYIGTFKNWDVLFESSGQIYAIIDNQQTETLKRVCNYTPSNYLCSSSFTVYNASYVPPVTPPGGGGTGTGTGGTPRPVSKIITAFQKVQWEIVNKLYEMENPGKTYIKPAKRMITSKGKTATFPHAVTIKNNLPGNLDSYLFVGKLIAPSFPTAGKYGPTNQQPFLPFWPAFIPGHNNQNNACWNTGTHERKNHNVPCPSGECGPRCGCWIQQPLLTNGSFENNWTMSTYIGVHGFTKIANNSYVCKQNDSNSANACSASCVTEGYTNVGGMANEGLCDSTGTCQCYKSAPICGIKNKTEACTYANLSENTIDTNGGAGSTKKEVGAGTILEWNLSAKRMKKSLPTSFKAALKNAKANGLFDSSSPANERVFSFTQSWTTKNTSSPIIAQQTYDQLNLNSIRAVIDYELWATWLPTPNGFEGCENIVNDAACAHYSYKSTPSNFSADPYIIMYDILLTSIKGDTMNIISCPQTHMFFDSGDNVIVNKSYPCNKKVSLVMINPYYQNNPKNGGVVNALISNQPSPVFETPLTGVNKFPDIPINFMNIMRPFINALSGKGVAPSFE